MGAIPTICLLRSPPGFHGFFPFELLDGRAVRGPLKESWKEPKKCGENVVSYVLSMQDKLATMAEMVKGNLERAQQKQELWYDQNARQRELKPGNLMLVLLPTSSSSSGRGLILFCTKPAVSTMWWTCIYSEEGEDLPHQYAEEVEYTYLWELLG